MKNYTILALALTVNVLFGQDLKTNDNQSQSSTNSIELNTIFDKDKLVSYVSENGKFENLKTNSFNKNNEYTFEFVFIPTMGVSIWKIDYNNDGIYTQHEETTAKMHKNLMDHNFDFVELQLSNNKIEVVNLTISSNQYHHNYLNVKNNELIKIKPFDSEVKISGTLKLNDNTLADLNEKAAMQINLGNSIEKTVATR